jgi:anti-anti-sigma regulatory factor/anti-sigma regulatory factor (Ser/Thr protein kinase)
MYKVSEEQNELTIEFSSIFQNVDRVINESKLFISTFISNPSFNDFSLLLREIINNAIEHGNKSDSSKIVKLSLKKINEKSVSCKITDDGEGFEHSKIDFSISQTTIRSRGLPLINKIADSIKFNEKGNEIEVIYSFPQTTNFEIITKNDKTECIPSDSITSTSGEMFKKALLNILANLPSKVEFNFSKVSEIDSVGLSMLFVFARDARNKNENINLSIENATIDLMQLFLSTGLDKYFSISI